MAVITPSSLISEIRGKVGDSFYSRNAHGPFVGEWSIPTNPQTSAQNNVRNGLATGMSNWQALPSELKEVWYDWAAQQTNPLSISRKPRKTAYTEYVGRFINRAVINGSNTIINPYAPSPVLLSCSIGTLSSGNIPLSFTVENESIGAYLVIAATNAISTGIRRPGKSDFRVIDTIEVTSASDTINIYSALTARWPLVSADIGKQVQIKCWLIHESEYTKSVEQYTGLIVSNDILASPPYIVQSTTAYQSATTSLSIIFPNPILAGDLIVIITAPIGGGNSAPIVGFSQLVQSGFSGTVQQFQYKVAGSGQSQGVVWTDGNTINRAAIGYVIRNAPNPTSPQRQTGVGSATTSTSALLASSSFAIPDFSLVIAALATNFGLNSSSVDDSFTVDQQVYSPLHGGYVLSSYIRSIDTAVNVQPTATIDPASGRSGATYYIS